MFYFLFLFLKKTDKVHFNWGRIYAATSLGLLLQLANSILNKFLTFSNILGLIIPLEFLPELSGFLAPCLEMLSLVDVAIKCLWNKYR